MKNLLKLMFAMAMCVMAVSCGPSRADIEKAIENNDAATLRTYLEEGDVNQELQSMVGKENNGLTVTRAEFGQKALEFDMEFDEAQIPFETLELGINAMGDQFKTAMIEGMSQDKSEDAILGLRIIKTLGLGMKMNFIGNNSKKSIAFELSGAEFGSALDAAINSK